MKDSCNSLVLYNCREAHTHTVSYNPICCCSGAKSCLPLCAPWTVAWLPCPSPLPGVCSDSCPSSWWRCPTVSSSVAPSPFALDHSQHQILFQRVGSYNNPFFLSRLYCPYPFPLPTGNHRLFSPSVKTAFIDFEFLSGYWNWETHSSLWKTTQNCKDKVFLIFFFKKESN